MIKNLLVLFAKASACGIVFIIAVMVGTTLSSILYPMAELATEVHQVSEIFMPWALWKLCHPGGMWPYGKMARPRASMGEVKVPCRTMPQLSSGWSLLLL